MSWIKISLTKEEKDRFMELSKKHKTTMSKLIKYLILTNENIPNINFDLSSLCNSTIAFQITKEEEKKLMFFISILQQHSTISKNQILRLFINNEINKLGVKSEEVKEEEKEKEKKKNENFKMVKIGFPFNREEKEKLQKKCKSIGLSFSDIFRKQYKSFHLLNYNKEIKKPLNCFFSIYIPKNEIKILEERANDLYLSKNKFIQLITSYFCDNNISKFL